MSAPDPYAVRPWLSLYEAGQPEQLSSRWGSMLEAVAQNAAQYPDLPVIRYFDGVITYRELDEATDALASGLRARGLEPGDRVAVMTQNNPQYLLAMVGVWKAGGAIVPVNPMNRERELGYILRDSGARGLICLESIYRDVASKVVDDCDVRIVLTTSELAYQSRGDDRVLAGVTRQTPDGAADLESLIDEHRAQRPPPVTLGPDDIAAITYTSGTTGEPKGATNTHGNLVAIASTFQTWVGLGHEDSVFAVAPLFHVTGMVAHAALCLLAPLTCVLAHRFDPQVSLELIEEHQCTFVVGAITAYVAMMSAPGADGARLSSVHDVFSGGAPIPPAVAERFEAFSGKHVHNGYGLTETSSAAHFVPRGARAPVDQESGALSIGVPVYDTDVRIVDDSGAVLPVGEVGELVIKGPGVVPAYWNKAEETARTMSGGWLRTGDVGFMNEDGWFFIVDRKKDMINASGYKVWPREVEDVLYTHPAVREAAVVGVADEYRGETVKAVVSLQAGQQTTPEELTAFCKERMAAYKYPRIIEITDELPKTVSGKILRRELRH